MRIPRWPLAALLSFAAVWWAGCQRDATQPTSPENPPTPQPAQTETPRPHVSAKPHKHKTDHPFFRLELDHAWQLNSPAGERFDASGLWMQTNGVLLTISDRGASVYSIEFVANANSANLNPLTNCFTGEQLAQFAAEKHGRYDCEGIAGDSLGRIYLCVEDNRWILRFDPRTEKVERLAIDWKPVKKYFNVRNSNASFEGVAVGGNRLYVANERDKGRIIVVDLDTLRIVDDFTVGAKHGLSSDVHYSDLSWFEGALYVLMREKESILKVDPKSHKILAEYNYSDIENNREYAYHTRSGVGVMEGLSVTKDCFWLVTDNNGLPRKRHPDDSRPTLFRCRRPDA
jgi:hypothetical protein